MTAPGADADVKRRSHHTVVTVLAAWISSSGARVMEPQRRAQRYRRAVQRLVVPFRATARWIRDRLRLVSRFRCGRRPRAGTAGCAVGRTRTHTIYPHARFGLRDTASVGQFVVCVAASRPHRPSVTAPGANADVKRRSHHTVVTVLAAWISSSGARVMEPQRRAQRYCRAVQRLVVPFRATARWIRDRLRLISRFRCGRRPRAAVR